MGAVPRQPLSPSTRTRTRRQLWGRGTLARLETGSLALPKKPLLVHERVYAGYTVCGEINRFKLRVERKPVALLNRVITGDAVKVSQRIS